MPHLGRRARAPFRTASARLVVLACLACATPGTRAASEPAPANRPNIVLLVADDLGFTDLGSFGSEIATPNLDELARRGTRFSSFHVASTCSPTRSMLLTGVDNHRNGVGNMPETIPLEHLGQPGYLGVLDENVATIAELLRDAGYRTYFTGKWHLGKEPAQLPGARGFERSVTLADSGADNWEQRTYLPIYDKAHWYEDDRETTLPEGFYSSKFYVDKMIDYVSSGQGDGKPFFAYVAFQASHIPQQAPRDLVEKYRGRYREGWTSLREERRMSAIRLGLVPPESGMVTMATTLDWQAPDETRHRHMERRMEVYAAMTEAMDQHIGRLVAHLKATGEYENTVFFFLSDNGAEPSDPFDIWTTRLWIDWHYATETEHLGEKGAYSAIGPSWASAAASPLATYKFYAGEGGIRVPLIVAGAGAARAGAIVDRFAHVTDVVPTMLEIAAVPAPTSTHRGRAVEPPIGRSLLAAARGQTDRVHPETHPIGYELSGNAALFKGDLKLVKNIPPVGDDQWHLYDIRLDPGEARDLRDALPEAYRTMQGDYERWAEENQVLPMPPGYVPAEQIETNFNELVLKPRLWAALPGAAFTLAVLALVAWGAYRMYRRRGRGAPAP